MNERLNFICVGLPKIIKDKIHMISRLIVARAKWAFSKNSIFLSKNGPKTVIDFFTREKCVFLASNGLHFEA